MENIEDIFLPDLNNAVSELFNSSENFNHTFQKTRKEFEGDITLLVFPYVKISKKSPEETASILGNYLKEKHSIIESFNIIKGFLNIKLVDKWWIDFLEYCLSNQQFGMVSTTNKTRNIMIEYPSPNTNKPLHLGHLRNIFLGSSLSEILKANGHHVIQSCLYNDRGTNISKSMLAWQLYGQGETPESTGKKGDHLVGEFYVKFANALKEEVAQLKAKGMSEEEAEKSSELNRKVNQLTVLWEQGDANTRELWKTMNSWVYSGFNKTFTSLCVKPDKFYYESDVYNLGKETVREGLEKGVFFQKEDGSVWIDLKAEGLDEKLVLRSNGTTVYITQDIAIANEKEKDFKIDQSIYVVGNEQDYHFKVLFLILKKLGKSYADNLFHLSYGMVELPSGKMKSREGSVVDADDLIDEMITTAKSTTEELGKTEDFTEEQSKELYRMIGLGALRYFILKVDPKKKMLFDPKESIDFNGNTGPFIQYTHARIKSVLRKSGKAEFGFIKDELHLNKREIELIKTIYEYPKVVKESANMLSPALIANYIYDLSKEFNQFYHELSILKEENTNLRNFRIALAYKIALIIKSGASLLCIDMPEKM
jgi:arginyl-tRNA synthetase